MEEWLGDDHHASRNFLLFFFSFSASFAALTWLKLAVGRDRFPPSPLTPLPPTPPPLTLQHLSLPTLARFGDGCWSSWLLADSVCDFVESSEFSSCSVFGSSWENVCCSGSVSSSSSDSVTDSLSSVALGLSSSDELSFSESKNLSSESLSAKVPPITYSVVKYLGVRAARLEAMFEET